MESEKEINDKIDYNYNQALLEKSIEAIAHGDNTFCYENFSDVPELFDALENYVKKNHQEHFLFEDAKKNLLNLIGYLRFEQQYPSEEDRVAKFHWCNKMIGLLNESTSENGVTHYCTEIAKRFQYQGYLTVDAFDKWLELVYYSITNDITLLESLDDKVDFFHAYYEEFLYNPYISNNINILLDQYPNSFFIEDLTKFNSILVGQYTLASVEDAVKLEIQVDKEKHCYLVDHEVYQKFKTGINVNFVAWLMNQITNVIDSSMSPVDGDIDIENKMLPTEENTQKVISKKK